MPTLQQITDASRTFVTQSTAEERDTILRQVANLGIGGPSIFEYEEIINAREAKMPKANWTSEISSLCDAISLALAAGILPESSKFSTAGGTDILEAA